MEWIAPCKNPATKEDLRVVQKTIIASSIAVSMAVIGAIRKTSFSADESIEFAKQMYEIIGATMESFDSLEQ